MAKISTKAPDDFDVIAQLLRNLITTHRGQVDPNADIVDMISMLDVSLENASSVLQEQNEALRIISNQHLQLSVKMAETINLLEKFANVGYDEALDNVALNFMDRLISTGAAEASDDGEALVLDQSVTITKADLKPLLRESISDWLELKTNE